MATKKNPVVFLEISVDGKPPERMDIELFADVVPKIAENFRALCTGEKGIGASTKVPLCYKGSTFHRIVKGFIAQGGDLSRQDGIGGESIYGRKFPDENFKLKHAGPGFLSLASSAPNSNGSQFFITFRATPELDGKNVVFGKVLSSSALLKKIEHAGTEKGKPLYMVKIVDCGEVSAGKIQVAARKEKEKLRKASSDSSSSDSSGGEQRSNHKRTVKEERKKRKRRYSSDSYSSDDSDSDTYSSDSVSSSESDSSYTSSSSGSRYKRRKRTLRKNKDKHGRRKNDRNRDRQQKIHNNRPTRKAKRSSISSSDSESGSTSNSSSGGEKPSPHDNIKNFKQSPQHTDISAKNDGRKQSLPAASVKPIATGNASKSERIVDPDGNASHEAGHVSKEKRDYPDVTNHSIEKFNERTKKPPNSSERSRKSRSPIKPKEYSIGSRGALPSMERTSSLTRAQHSGDADRSLDRGISRRSKSHSRSPRRELDSSKKPSPTGPPKRIRKGRGFSEQYAYVRKYRTPSPEHSPIRSHYYRARYELGRERNRYPRRPFYADRSPVRRYRGSPRGNSPPGYRTRRDRSRSLSRSPIRGRQRDRSQSRRQSRSPLDRQKPAPSSQLESRLGPQGHDFRFAREQSRSKSPSLSKFRSDAGRACTADKGRSRSTSKSSSPNAANGLVAYGDGSPNK
ncbi:peptidyl-prolyl cis-trans isomerase CYP63-like isoform X2 [Zingiber officinale]|uniref:peptidyl-prolyl cis-trans isomerase CYP63-like isoform X2 n=1 Tax=Zingiber officinale TaxID=94328 RepID=UPI001C4A8A75|nr:peptidyl-prolyl cis-trans isomerase CYP63-like isoform X2 [Zingiber officinale]